MFPLDQIGILSSRLFVKYGSFTNYLIGAIVLLGFARDYFSRGAGIGFLRVTPLQFLLSILLIFTLCSILWSPMPMVAMNAWKTQILYYVVICFVAPMIFRDTEDFKIGILAFIWFATMMNLYIMLAFGWERRALIGVDGELVRLPLALANLGGLLAISAAFYRFKEGIVTRLLSLSVIVIGVALVYRSGSRGQFAAAFISIVVFLPLALGGRALSRYFYLFIFVVLFLVPAAYFVHDSADSRWSEGEVAEDATGRIDMAGKLLETWMAEGPASLLFGLGNSASYSPRIVGYYPHVVPAEVLGEEGVIGFIIFSTILLKSRVEFRKARQL